jgi:hypothetical protein
MINLLKLYLIFVLLVDANNSFSQQKSIEVTYSRRNRSVIPEKIYLVKGDSAFQLKFKENKIIFPDTITRRFIDMILIYKNEITPISYFDVQKSQYIHIYYDNRLFGNSITKQFKEYSKKKYLFSKRYLIRFGLEYYNIAKRSKKKYILR